MKGKAMLLSKRYISIMLLGALTVFLTTVVLWHRPAPCATPPTTDKEATQWLQMPHMHHMRM